MKGSTEHDFKRRFFPRLVSCGMIFLALFIEDVDGGSNNFDEGNTFKQLG